MVRAAHDGLTRSDAGHFEFGVVKHPTKELLVLARADGVHVLACPTPGRVAWRARPGETLAPGAVGGVLVQDARVFDLVLPAGARAHIREVMSPHPWAACGRGAALAVLGQADSAASAADESPEFDAGDVWEVRSPTHGTFYTRPRPGEPTYVSPDQVIEPGATLGLVEVMKCFSPITFEPPKGARRGRIREVLAADGAEVRADQTLLRVTLVE